MRGSRLLGLAGMSAMALACSVSHAASFVAFESASVRPMAMSPDGTKLFVTNTPDNTVEVFDVAANGNLTAAGSIPVGMEPVAIAARNANELWVVNHLSDSVSVVDTSTNTVKRTLLVGDEPRDIVFAQGKAFVTTAHRGQHRTHPSIASAFGDNDGDPQLHTPSVARADVWVFDGADQGISLGGTPTKVIEMFGDTPRGLAVSPDGNTVYAAVFNSGNQTSVVHEGVICGGFEDINPQNVSVGGYTVRVDEPTCTVQDGITSPNGMANGGMINRPGPGRNAAGEIQTWTSVMVKYDRGSGEWRDARGANLSNGIRFTLPDHDVFAINAQTLNQTDDFEHVGTTLFNVATNPQNGNIYVTNTEANNAVRFEGPGAHGGSTVQGNIARSQITVITPDGTVKPRALNTHIDYSNLKGNGNVKQHTVATPTEIQVSSDGATVYVAALGSDKVAVYNTADLENDALWDGNTANGEFDGAAQNHINVAGGPAGVLLDEAHNGDNGQLYVLTRFDNSVKVVDASTGAERQSLAMYNPEPAAMQAGRFMLYDANRSSSNGEASCASCHIFGDMDHLSWNLGNPDGGNTVNTNPFPTEHFTRLSCETDALADDCFFAELLNGDGGERTLGSMKGPMTTQTMRGMSTAGHMHWRGDRVTGYFGTQDASDFTTPDQMETLDERLSFKNFIVAFEGLLGMEVDLEGGVGATGKSAKRVALENDVDKFADFMLSVQLPPNPIVNLDRSHSASAALGDAFFDGPRRGDGVHPSSDTNGREDGKTCEGCHTHDPARGFYGTDGKVAHGGEILVLKVPHFRNLYQKIGMFGLPDRNGFLISPTKQHQGDQVRGFGFLHDGATDLLFNFLSGGVFDNSQTGCSNGNTAAENGCTYNDQAGGPVGIPNDTVRQGLVDYMLEFDTDLAPVVGQQMTLTAGATADMLDRVSFLEGRAGSAFVSKILGGNVTDCDLAARGTVAGQQRGYLYDPANNNYVTDLANEAPVSAADIRTLAQAAGNALTFTCVPPGSGVRVALDRDEDGTYNCDEDANCSGGGSSTTSSSTSSSSTSSTSSTSSSTSSTSSSSSSSSSSTSSSGGPSCTTYTFDSGMQGWSKPGFADCARGNFVAASPTQRSSRGVRTQVAGDVTGGNALFTATNTAAGRNDVDNGSCAVESPVLDTTSQRNLTLSYFHGQRDANDQPNNGDQDGFGIYYSTDGGNTSTALVEIGDARTVANWTDLSAELPASNNLKLYVVVSDGRGAGDIIEGGIDNVKICQ